MGRAHVQLPPFHPHRPTLVAPVRVDPTGLAGPTRGQAACPRWRRTSHGLYVPAHVVLGVEQRILEAGVLLPRFGAVTGWAALRWRRARWFDGTSTGQDGDAPVDLALSATSDLRSQPGIAVCRERWTPYDVETVDGLRVTTAVRSVAFAMRYAASLWKAVTVLDMAAYDDLVSVSEVAQYAGHAPRFGLSSWTGIPQCRRAVLLANENSWSPREVWLRLVWELGAGLPRPLMNHPVFDRRGRHVGTPDLIDPGSGTVGQYDSSLHLEGSQRVRDVMRDEAFRAVGLESFSVVTGETSDVAARRMIATRERALSRSGPRLWTIDPPAYWIPTVTVDQRRALTDDQRERLLRHRHAA